MALSAAAGAIVVLGALLLASGARWQAARGRTGAVAVGVIAALTNVLAAVAGPAVALWTENADWSADRQRATLQAFFLGLNLVALASLGPPHLSARLLAGCVLALAAGRVARFAVIGGIVRFAGDRLVARLERRLGRPIETVH